MVLEGGSTRSTTETSAGGERAGNAWSGDLTVGDGAVQSVVRAFALLSRLAGDPAGVSELAQRVDLPRSTVSRLLSTLGQIGAVSQTDDEGLYQIGPLVAQLAMGVGPSQTLQTVARQTLVSLVQDFGESAGISVLDESVDVGEVLYLDHVEATGDVQVRDWTGERLQFHSVSAGLVLMANAPIATQIAALDRPLHRYTDSTIVDRHEVLARLERVRSAGLAWTVNELSEDITSVAAPIRDSEGTVVAAVHIHGPSYRFPGEKLVSPIEAGVIEAADRISALLSY